MPQLRAYVVLAIMCVVGFWGCQTGQRTQLRPETFVGEYVYYSADKGAPHHPDRLTLRADGKYILVYVSDAHPASREEGVWQLVRDPAPNILLDHAGYLVQIDGKHVRLLINNDLGQWYEKTE